MLRVGLTGGLGSGKSTAARLFAAHGARVLSADAIGRELMEPGQAVYAAIVAHFGAGVVMADGRLDRGELARIAFGLPSEGGGRVEELNAIVHPATIRRQAELIEAIFAEDRNAVVMVESALILETKHGDDAGWRRRFDRLILVTASEEVKIARFVARGAGGEQISTARREELEEEARRRLAQQSPDEQKSALCDYVLTNGGGLKELEWQVDQLWPILKRAAE
jgi:dephospho-CoA kinase